MRMARAFAKDVEEAKSVHAPEADFDPGKVAALYVSIIQGSNILAKTEESNEVIAENLRQFRVYPACLRHGEKTHMFKFGEPARRQQSPGINFQISAMTALETNNPRIKHHQPVGILYALKVRGSREFVCPNWKAMN